MKRKAALTHFDEGGNARMVDVGDKEITERVAVARASVTMQAATLKLIRDKKAKKGDVLAVAQLAGIMAAKKTPDLIPLCHPLASTNTALPATRRRMASLRRKSPMSPPSAVSTSNSARRWARN